MAAVSFCFYLGTHEPSWLSRCNVPLMVSRNRFDRRASLPIASVDWVMDSGGFTELQQFGYWRTDAHAWAAKIDDIAGRVGRMVWAAPQDWMCEPAVIHGGTFKGTRFAGTGLTVAEHQARTVGNFLDLMALGAPVIPVLQGYTLGDYERCVDLYARAGVDLGVLPTVGLGSICRRENTEEIASVVWAMRSHGIRCHGFGAKEGAVRRVGDLLASADSMAWSKGGKERGTCTHLKSRCANHMHWALDWRAKLLAAPRGGTAQIAMAL